MAFELKQNLKLSQQLIMTPQLQQAIKLLQLSRMEMIDVINQEMEENPLLEDAPLDEYEETERDHGHEEGKITEIEELKGIERTEEITGEGDGKEDFDWNSYLEDYGTVGANYDRKDGDAPAWDNLLTEKSSLTDHLMWQLKLSRFTDLEMKVGEQIIGNLDQNGYLAASVEEIARLESVTEEQVEAVLEKIQEYDPPGIAARTLQECLLIQVKSLGIENRLVEIIIKNHMKDLEIKNYNHIAKKNKVTIEDVLQAVMVISNMDPRPGSVYNEERIQAIIPDVYVFKAGDEYKIVLNDDGLPRLRISNFYKEIMGSVKNNSHSENGKKYIRERVQSATWLIKSIQQRQRTIYKVAESIVRYQKEFFDRGISYLKPLVLRDIAYDVEMHESTISRVVTNKYMYTPRGIFELKYFFSSSIQKKSGETIASKVSKRKSEKLSTRKILGIHTAITKLSAS